MKLLALLLLTVLLTTLVLRASAAQEPARDPEQEPGEAAEPVLAPFEAFAKAALFEGEARKKTWHAFLERPSMTCGIYRLAAGARDRQEPHDRDEVYYVVEGKGRFSAAGETRAVAPGDVLFVEREAEHRFHDITEELVLLVFFSSAKPVQAGAGPSK